MKRTLTGIAAAAVVLGTLSPMAFAATTKGTAAPTLTPAGGKTITLDGKTLYAGVQAGTAVDAGNTTTYFPIYYLEHALTDAGYVNTYNPSTHVWNLQLPGVDATKVSVAGGVGSGNAAISINGIVVKKFNAIWHKDLAGGKNAVVTTYFPLYYLGNVLEAAGFTSAWDGTTGQFSFDSNYGAAAALTASAASSSVVANGASTDTVTVNVVDANGHLVRNYNGPVTVALTGSGTSFSSTQPSDVTTTGINGSTTQITANAVNGVATFSVVAGNVPGLTSTYTASFTPDGATTAQTATATVNTVAQVATSVQVAPATSGQKYIANNQAGSSDYVAGEATFTATVLDQAGKPMLTGSYPITFAVSGPATSNSQTSTAYVDGTAPNFTVNSEQGASGTVIVTASSDGLASGSASVQSVTVGNAASVQLSQSRSTFSADNAGTDADVITVQAVDANGHPTSYNGTMTVALTQNGTTSTGLTLGGDDSDGTLNFSNGVAKIDVSGVTDTKAGTYTITLTDPNKKLATQTANVLVTPGEFAKLVVTKPSGDSQIGISNPTATITAQAEDAEGNAVAQSGIPVSFAITSGSTSEASLNASKVSTNAQGQASVVLTSQPYVNNAYVVTASATNASNDTVSAASSTITIQNVVASSDWAKLTAANSGTLATAGNPLTLTLGSKDSYGNAVSGDNYTLVLKGVQVEFNGSALSQSNEPAGVVLNSDGSISVSGTAVGTNGQVNGLSFVAAKAGTDSVTVTDNTAPSTPSATASVTTVAGKQTGYAFFDANGNLLSTNSAGQFDSFAAGTPTEVWLKPVDSENNPTTVASTNTVQVNIAGSNGSFRSTASGSDLQGPVQLAPGSAGVALYFVNNGTFAAYTDLTAK